MGCAQFRSHVTPASLKLPVHFASFGGAEKFRSHVTPASLKHRFPPISKGAGITIPESRDSGLIEARVGIAFHTRTY